jgi:predicted nucleic acid-binding protein
MKSRWLVRVCPALNRYVALLGLKWPPLGWPAEPFIERACRALGAGERGAILLAKATNADLTLLDESKARRIARDAGLSVVGCIGLLEAGWRSGIVRDLRQAHTELLRQGIRLDLKLLQDSLAKLGLPGL